MTVNGIAMEPRITGAPIAGGRKANGFELTADATWADVMALKGTTIPGFGVVLEVSAPRREVLKAGSTINLVTAD